MSMKKLFASILCCCLIGLTSTGFAAKDSVSSDGLQNLVFPKIGAIFFADGGLRGDEKVEEQVKSAVHQKLAKVKNLNYMNDGLMSAKFQEFAFRKNITDGNNLYPFGAVTVGQLIAFGQENRMHSLVLVESVLLNVDEKRSESKPGVESKSEFSSKVEIRVKIFNPERGGVIHEYRFPGEAKNAIAIKSYWSAMSKAVKNLKSDWKPEFY